MPPNSEPKQQSPMKQGGETGAYPYPPHAFEFVHEGLDYTVTHAHGPQKPGPQKPGAKKSGAQTGRHVTGQQLCEGLRELALMKWGRMARTVLRRWNITTTLDFGRIVYAQIEMGLLQKVDEDSIEDFQNVYDFEAAFESDYRIPSHS